MELSSEDWGERIRAGSENKGAVLDLPKNVPFFKYSLCFPFFPPVTLLGGMGRRGRRSPTIYGATVGFCGCVDVCQSGIEKGKNNICSGIRNKRLRIHVHVS